MTETIEKIVNAWWKDRLEVEALADGMDYRIEFDDFKIVLTQLLPEYKFFMQGHQWFISYPIPE